MWWTIDRFNRQLHEPEKTKAQEIAAQAVALGVTNPDGSPITAAQIENAMRGTNNSPYGEIAATGVVVPLNASTPAGTVYDTAGMKLVMECKDSFPFRRPLALTRLERLLTRTTEPRRLNSM